MKVYFAGKVGKDDWRHRFVDLRGAVISPDAWRGTWALPMLHGTKHTYVGPFYISCDHGCGHRDSGHGAMSGCTSDVTKREVYSKAHYGIRSADIVFVYAGLDFGSAFGTHSEIGYAQAHRKPVVIVAHPDLDLDPFWFICENTTLIINHDPFEAICKVLRFTSK